MSQIRILFKIERLDFDILSKWSAHVSGKLLREVGFDPRIYPLEVYMESGARGITDLEIRLGPQQWDS